MLRKRKAFDCVEMKNRIQAERLTEYEARKGEFASYIEFIKVRIRKSKLAKIVCQKARRYNREPTK